MTKSPENMPDSIKFETKNNPINPELFEKLAKEREKNAEKSKEGAEEIKENARFEAIEAATNAEKDMQKSNQDQIGLKTEKNFNVGKKHKDESYKKTIKRVQSELRPTEKVFSKIIHNDSIEKTSEVIGKSIARPNPIFYGGVFAFVITLGTYFIAKRIGYTLSGSETILSFAIGYLFGFIIDYIKLLFSRRK